jgi:hypothetical protein
VLSRNSTLLICFDTSIISYVVCLLLGIFLFEVIYIEWKKMRWICVFTCSSAGANEWCKSVCSHCSHDIYVGVIEFLDPGLYLGHGLAPISNLALCGCHRVPRPRLILGHSSAPIPSLALCGDALLGQDMWVWYRNEAKVIQTTHLLPMTEQLSTFKQLHTHKCYVSYNKHFTTALFYIYSKTNDT